MERMTVVMVSPSEKVGTSARRAGEGPTPKKPA